MRHYSSDGGHRRAGFPDLLCDQDIAKIPNQIFLETSFKLPCMMMKIAKRVPSTVVYNCNIFPCFLDGKIHIL